MTPTHVDSLAWARFRDRLADAIVAGLPPAPPPVSVRLQGVTVSELLAAIKFTGIVASNRDGRIVLHRRGI
jgi:hypothetical protein